MGVTTINNQSITSSAITQFDNTTGVGPYYVLFSPISTNGGYTAAYIDSSGLTYNATSNTLTATTFAGTASAANRVDVGQGSGNATNYLIFTPQFNAGGTNPAAVSQSGNATYNPSTLELRAALLNQTQNGTKTLNTDTNLTIDASLTQSMVWSAAFTTTRSLIVNNLADGREVDVYIRNTNATQRQIIFSASANTTGHAAVNMSTGAGAVSVTTQNIAGSTGTMYVIIKNIGGTFAGGIM